MALKIKEVRQDIKNPGKFLGRWNGETETDRRFKLASASTLTHLLPSPLHGPSLKHLSPQANAVLISIKYP